MKVRTQSPWFAKGKWVNLLKVVSVFVITCLFLYVSQFLWLENSLIVSFDIKTEKNMFVQVFYTGEPKTSFHEENSLKKDVLKGNSRVEFRLPIEKILRFRLDLGIEPGTVVLSNLKIKGDKSIKLKGDELFNFSKDVEAHSFDGNFFHIKSDLRDPYMVYKEELNIAKGNMVNRWMFLLMLVGFVIPCYFAFRHKKYVGAGIAGAAFLTVITCQLLHKDGIDVDWYAFIIMASAYFFFIYRLGKYLADFKRADFHSRIDIVMVGVFFTLLFLPMLHLSQAEKSEQENRMLAVYKPLIQDKKFNLNFGKDFDAWFSDRFFGREALLKLAYHVIHFKNEKVLVQDNNWLFYKGDNSLQNYMNKPTFSDQKLKQGADYLNGINRWCQKHDKKFYYLIAPDKNKIYGEYINDINKLNDDTHGIGFQFADYLEKNTDVKVIYPYEALYQNKDKGLLYYKNDTHWNQYGAYFGYKELEKALLQDFTFEPLVFNDWKETEYNGDLAQMLGYQKYEDKTVYKELNVTVGGKCAQTQKYQRENGVMTCVNGEAKLNKRAFILRDSFSIALQPYYQHLFANAVLHWKRNLTTEDLKEIEANYDIVILETVERYTPSILDLKFPKE